MGGIDWIDLAWDREEWWAFVNAVMKCRVPSNAANFLTVSFSSSTVLRGVS